MYKGPHLADYCTRCSTSALSYGCLVDTGAAEGVHIWGGSGKKIIIFIPMRVGKKIVR